jgi:hypothetical protein
MNEVYLYGCAPFRPNEPLIPWPQPDPVPAQPFMPPYPLLPIPEAPETLAHSDVTARLFAVRVLVELLRRTRSSAFNGNYVAKAEELSEEIASGKWPPKDGKP